MSLRTSLLNLELVAAAAPATAAPASTSSPAPPSPPAAAPAAAIAARLFARSHDQIAASNVGAVELADQLLGVGRDPDLDLCTNQTVSRVLASRRWRGGRETRRDNLIFALTSTKP